MFHMKPLVTAVSKWQVKVMSEREAALRIGEALGKLRRERGLSQAEAGARIGMTSQGWSLYESGRRAGLFRPDMLRRLTAALEATPEDLMLMVIPSPAGARSSTAGTEDEAPVTGMASRGRLFEVPPTPSPARQRFLLNTDEMAPWAFADTVIEYEPGRVPRSRRGCVLVLRNGERLVRLWVRGDENNVVVTYAQGQRETYPTQEIREISEVTARLEAD